MEPMAAPNLLLEADDWEGRDGIHAAGTAFYGGDRLDASGLVDLFAGTPADEVASRARELNGLFAAVRVDDDEVIVVSDRVGSRALFYGREEPRHLGDSFGELRSRVGGGAVPDDRRLEYLMATYVSGRETLDPAIRKTRPGTVLRVDLEDGSVSERRYYAFRDDPQPERYDEDHYPEWKATLEGAFERFVRVLDGRQVALGLSGGYDSRLIATMLDRVGYDDVVTFTYTGIQDGAYEARVAREVAADVGFDWVELELSREAIREARDSALWRAVVRALGSSGMSHTHPVEVVLHEVLSGIDRIDDDRMRVNGHQLFGAGAYVPERLLDRTEPTDSAGLADAIFEMHYREHDFDTHEVDLVKGRIRRSADLDRALDPDEAFEAVERWVWGERLPNFLTMRALLRMDPDVWFPLMDAELLEFWNRIPRTDRYDKRLYERWVDDLYRETYGRVPETASVLKRRERTVQASGLDRLFWRLRYSPLGEYVETSRVRPYASAAAGLVFGRAATPAEFYRRDPLFAFVDEERFVREYTGREGFRYVLANEILHTLDPSG